MKEKNKIKFINYFYIKLLGLNNLNMYYFLTNYNYILFSFIFSILKLNMKKKNQFLAFFFFHWYLPKSTIDRK